MGREKVTSIILLGHVLLAVAGASGPAQAQDLDVLIDGNGEGVYGDPGTGMGGSSTREGLPGTVVSFTLEIKNQGSEKNKYRITWSTLPGWTALVEGSPPPFITPNIPADSSYFCFFQVSVPLGAWPGDYSYIVDVKEVKYRIKQWESVEAIVSVPIRSQPDLVIDGNGAGITAPVGSGGGGSSSGFADTGASFYSTLRVQNTGEAADSFTLFWQDPMGWPQGSVLLDDGTATHSSPFTTPLIAPGGYIDYTISVSVPAGAAPEPVRIILDAASTLSPRTVDSVLLELLTYATVAGRAFDDVDHDLLFSPDDVGMAGIRLLDLISGGSVVTGADGYYVLHVPGGSASAIVEENPSGYLSLTPDTVSLGALSAGDTVLVDFVDVSPLYLSPGTTLEGLCGSYVDFPHELRVGTRGQVTLDADAGGAVVMLMLDADGDGRFSTGDKPLSPSDTYMDPASGNSVVHILARLFIPAPLSSGERVEMVLTALQDVEGTPYQFNRSATDMLVVVGSSVGRLVLAKDVDTGSAAPGDVITYTIRYLNAGTDSVREVVLLDPVDPVVDPVIAGFGPGMDVRWEADGAPVRYLTIAAGDGDECDYLENERLLRITLSLTTPYPVPPGYGGSFTYKVRIK